MRVGKKTNAVDAKKTRSCVVRLEKVGRNSPNVSPSPEDNRSSTRTRRVSSTTMAPTPKGRKGVGLTSHQEDKQNSASIKKRVGPNSNSQQQKLSNSNVSSIRSNQKIKIIPRSNKSTPASTPSRDETPPPTIAAGRSRRAIKPNPKYASEDMVTPKVVRNVAHLGSTGSRAGSIAPGHGGAGKNRKTSTSSDDFYNRNSEDEYENTEDNEYDDDDLKSDKVYQVNEKDEHDSDYSVMEEQPARTVKARGRPKKIQSIQSTPTTVQHANSKLLTHTPSSRMKRITTSDNYSNLRSAPSQLQQIRRSLASASAQRNIDMLASSVGSTGQKRKLEEIQDSSDNDSSYTISRKQLLLSNSSGLKVKVPVRENRVNAASTPITKNRLAMQKLQTPNTSQQQQTLNGSNRVNYTQQTTLSRRALEISAKTSNPLSVMKSSQRQSASTVALNNQKTQQKPTLPMTQAKILAAKANRFRSGSPKQATQKERQNINSAISISSAIATSSNANTKTSDKTSMRSKTAGSTSSDVANEENRLEIKDDSPNSTMDDFETMPTFTIVNVNDIINKKGDVLITKSKLNTNRTPTVIEFSESISLDDEDDNEEAEEIDVPPTPAKKRSKPSIVSNRKELEKKKNSLSRAANESLRKLPTQIGGPSSANTQSQPPPHILNHKLGLRSSRIAGKSNTTLTATLKSPDKPAPRILNSMVAKKTQPVKPMIANMDDSADESFPLSLDEDEDEDDEREDETEDEIQSRTVNRRQISSKNKKREPHKQNLGFEVDNEDTESQNTEDDITVLQASNNNNDKYNSSNNVALTPKQNTDPSPVQRRRGRTPNRLNTPIVVSSNQKRLTLAAAKENSLAATNRQVNSKQSNASTLPMARKSTAEKVVISKQGDKIIKKITCFETWYVINMPMEQKRPSVMRNQLEMPLIRLANSAKNVSLPNHRWSCKVSLYELSPQTLAKGTFATYTGDLTEHNINEEDRAKYQPSCVMFRRSIEKSQMSRMPYDRAVIFKNKTFYTNIEGKNIRLVGAPSIINTESEIEILLEVIDGLTLQSDFVEYISIVQ